MKEIAWQEQEPDYAEALKSDVYHELRLRFVESLLPNEKNLKVIDFGCGEGVLARKIALAGATHVIGIDPSPGLIDLAKSFAHLDNLDYSLGAVEVLQKEPPDSVDLILIINVLAYMSAQEEADFYREARRVLKPRASLVVTHSNELFDMFTLNNLTVEFFARHFASDISGLLSDLSRTTKIETYGIRENPLNYPSKLVSLGFNQREIRFFHHHPNPPLLDRPVGQRNNVNKGLEEASLNRSNPLWTEFFTCSTFGVRATKDH